jgi:hypothetical protein
MIQWGPNLPWTPSLIISTQMDLFISQARADLVGAERQKAVELFQALLAEALSKSTSKQEAGNE